MRFLPLAFLAACLTEETFEESYHDSLCDYFERCDVDWEASAADFGVETCTDYLAAAKDESATDAWTPESAQACLDYNRDTPCEDREQSPCGEIWN